MAKMHPSTVDLVLAKPPSRQAAKPSRQVKGGVKGVKGAKSRESRQGEARLGDKTGGGGTRVMSEVKGKPIGTV
jgi:hypothetical protein